MSYYVTNLISDLYLNFIHTFFKNTRWKPGSLRCMWRIPAIKIKTKKQLVLMQFALVPSPHVLTVTPHPIRTSKKQAAVVFNSRQNGLCLKSDMQKMERKQNKETHWFASLLLSFTYTNVVYPYKHSFTQARTTSSRLMISAGWPCHW